jgi:carboxypeptidase family protein
VGEKSLLVAADHPTAGRSTIARVASGPTSVEVNLQLQALRSLDGRVTSAGQALANAMVTAAPQQAALGTFSVRTDTDGSYRFDKLTPDTYVVSASRERGFRGNIRTQTVTISAQQDAHLDIDLPSGTVTVALGIVGPAGSSVHTAQVSLLSGHVQATTAIQLVDAAAARGDGSAHMGYVFGGVPASLTEVTPGDYSACAVPIPIDLRGPGDLAQLLDKRDKLVCVCIPVTITPSPDAQNVTVQVPIPPRI